MSNYNSTNTHILATHEAAGGNTRMLLFHVCESGRHEYVVGSYFRMYKEYIDRWYDGAGRRHTVVADDDGNCFTLDGHEVVGRVNGDWWKKFDKPGKFYYEWDWGHYFGSVVDAVDYWQREVAADLLEGFKIHTGTAKCPKCGEPLEPSDLPEYKYVCYGCDENFYGFEAKFEVE